MEVDLDIRELERFADDIIRVANNDFPKESKAFMRNEGNKLKRLTLSTAKARIKPKKGNLFKAIKRGKVYKYAPNDAWAVRVIAGKGGAHANLLEYGHRIVVNGVELGETEKKKFFSDSAKQFESTYATDCSKFVDKIVDKMVK